MFRQWAVVVFAADPAAGVSAGVVAVVGGVDGLRRARDYSEERHYMPETDLSSLPPSRRHFADPSTSRGTILLVVG